MADVYGHLLQTQFYSVLTALIGYLRRQQNLVADMKTTCPKVALSRWLSMIKVMKWFKKHRIVVQTYLDEKRPACRPSAGWLPVVFLKAICLTFVVCMLLAWWVLMMAVHEFANEASFVFKRIQGMTVLMSQQVSELANLSSTFCRLVAGKGPLIESELQAMAQASAQSGGLIVAGLFATSVANVEQFVSRLGIIRMF